MKIILINGKEVGILSREDFMARTLAIAKGEEVERKDLKRFAETEEAAQQLLEIEDK